MMTTTHFSIYPFIHIKEWGKNGEPRFQNYSILSLYFLSFFTIPVTPIPLPPFSLPLADRDLFSYEFSISDRDLSYVNIWRRGNVGKAS
jgi:hypothetical protein